MYYIPQISQLPAEYHPTQWVADRSLDFLESVSEDSPFFLMSSFIHPHPPFAPPSPWNKLYRTVSADPYMPENPEEFAPFMSDRFTREILIGIAYIFLKEWLYGLDEITAFKAYAREVETMLNTGTTEPEVFELPAMSEDEEVMYVVNDGVIF